MLCVHIVMSSHVPCVALGVLTAQQHCIAGHSGKVLEQFMVPPSELTESGTHEPFWHVPATGGDPLEHGVPFGASV